MVERCKAIAEDLRLNGDSSDSLVDQLYRQDNILVFRPDMVPTFTKEVETNRMLDCIWSQVSSSDERVYAKIA